MHGNDREQLPAFTLEANVVYGHGGAFADVDLASSGAAGFRVDQIEITGTTGALRFSCFGQEPLELLTAGGVECIEAPYPEIVQLPLIQSVVDALTRHGDSPSSGQSAVRTARVIDGLLAGYRDDHGLVFRP